MTVHCWGEKAEGQWTLEITDSPSQLRNPEVLGKGQKRTHTQTHTRLTQTDIQHSVQLTTYVNVENPNVTD